LILPLFKPWASVNRAAKRFTNHIQPNELSVLFKHLFPVIASQCLALDTDALFFALLLFNIVSGGLGFAWFLPNET